MVTRFEAWVAEATAAALAKDNSALPLNRRVRQANGGLNRYVRGTLVVLGALYVAVDKPSGVG